MCSASCGNDKGKRRIYLHVNVINYHFFSFYWRIRTISFTILLVNSLIARIAFNGYWQGDEEMVKPVPIVRLKKGNIVRVVRLLLSSEDSNLRKMAAFGILPGVVIKVLQTYPIYVLEVGYTQIALDFEIAKNIIVILE